MFGFAAGGMIEIALGALELELRSARSVYRWPARVGFVHRADNVALLGHAGFLDRFGDQGSRESRVSRVKVMNW